MLSERLLTGVVGTLAKNQLTLKPPSQDKLPDPVPGRPYTLYAHVPFCERLCPYCSFNRFPYREERARDYFASLRKEMRMLADQGYDFESMYVGGGTPTVDIDELCETIDLARELFSIREVNSETNPNHLIPAYLDKLKGRVQRLSVGVQSFDDELLKQMDRYEKYGSGQEIFERIGETAPYFESLNVDMIFNFPSQTEDILFSDLEKITLCGCDQTTFSPLYQSHATTRKMENVLGNMDYEKERRFYHIIDEVLAGGEHPFFERRTLWTFNRLDENQERTEHLEVDEYAVSYEECVGIGSGSITHLDHRLLVNTFDLKEYGRQLAEDQAPLLGQAVISRRDMMRYKFLLQLYALRFDKHEFERDFGVSVERGLPAEMAFMRLNGAFATDNDDELTLTPRGRYLTVVLYRQYLASLNNLREQARSQIVGLEHDLLFGDGTEK
ncbi:coproporphyrinogen III oxidase family protein [Adlercreutzia equolifaciens]|uniref:coproporphyrinogen III oxidase family protein n=1 Tax=Adlercreutzia equolifaciens TaxID=446660 RepID=UPI0023AE6F72|nr:coproporphyrinogen III oxidase family protein [Adlercreutzia equolifaciens]MDE8703158.1 coproporphyrinogen III oxidase family protein [Adlercreutzia equolifaciens]